MDGLSYFIIAGLLIMACAVPLMILYAILEKKWREDQVKRHVRKVLMRELELEKELEERKKQVISK